ncbi:MULTISPECIES: YccS family putative transporter [Acinetobacter]|uniref:TIGR01666 family membrane protein n=2 Tax=Acinetobacter haemolyticus TaxID=29430 RepID=A0AAJ3D999_ACIHA|nr:MULTISPECIES: YccS family putative transporter [Acinetobacter]APR69237.1 TIGR01666 family membrane protein [Acinetobacter haemolyticus]EEH67826.1 TIGR01666 family membrane protein [Acinetobacter sp. ATCC 27244]EFF81328.1 TIGR01666 family membrane protein [Acinetobacter haemolyticus ATCC 19194]MCU4388260.1 TIGR01666 family membrane protein [Acinetobacter haemolyticus]MQZ31515.1 TIGR01666 family membrane protein [Acinetobacter haemolyticus]
MNSLYLLFNRFGSNSILRYCLQIFIVLIGTTLLLHALGLSEFIVPVTLGAIAAALTDFDDRLSIRLRNLFYVCVLFFTVSTILTFLAPYKFWFIVYLSLSSAAFVLMGALGQRYATISFGTILLSIYTMFGLGDYPHWYQQPSYFVCGALWYGFTSILFFIIHPTLPLQEKISTTFKEMGELLQSKAKLFDPDNVDNVETLLFELSQKNAQVVNSLNQAKQSLLSRLKSSRMNNSSIYWLNLYYFAQDIHEQVTSNYLHYEKIHQNFNRSDLIFRIQKNMFLQATACKKLSQALLHKTTYQNSPLADAALAQLEASMQDWIAQHPYNLEVKNLELILNNLKSIHEQFAQLQLKQNIETGSPQHQQAHLNLLDEDIQGFQDFFLKIKQHLSPQSALFRHAIRLAIVFAVGYAISLLPFAKNGYWILLTSLFVCQITYFATKSRLKLRTIGTLLGVLLGIPILYFVPSIEGQLIITVISGVYFFYLRQKKYALATVMATLMVLLIFNLKGAGFSIVLPRMIDTLIGCAIAWLAVNLIWPDWNFRNIPENIRKSSQATLDYFDAVIQQYHQGRSNDLEYRKARRAAHNAQIELSNMISSLSTEPQPNQELIHYAFRYLVYSHSQLSYVSALGHQRTQIQDQHILALLDQSVELLKHALIQQQPIPHQQIEDMLIKIQHLSSQGQVSEQNQLLLKQISLLLETLTELVMLKNKLLELEIR